MLKTNMLIVMYFPVTTNDMFSLKQKAGHDVDRTRLCPVTL